MNSIASIHLSLARVQNIFCTVIDSTDLPPCLELTLHLVPVVASSHQVPGAAEMIRFLPMRG